MSEEAWATTCEQSSIGRTPESSYELMVVNLDPNLLTIRLWLTFFLDHLEHASRTRTFSSTKSAPETAEAHNEMLTWELLPVCKWGIAFASLDVYEQS